MPLSNSSVTQIGQVISQVTAPAFLLGAVAAFTSVLISRMNRIIDSLIAAAGVFVEPTFTPLMSPEICGEAIAKAKQIITPQKSAS
jgi:hypothetical protein